MAHLTCVTCYTAVRAAEPDWHRANRPTSQFGKRLIPDIENKAVFETRHRYTFTRLYQSTI